MGVPYIKVNWFQKGSSTAIEITDGIKWDVKKGLEVKNTTAKIPMKNSWMSHINLSRISGWNGDFAPEDTIKIYLDWAPITETDDQLVFLGEITQVELKGDNAKNQITIHAMDKTALILNNVWSGQYKNKPAPEIIKNIIEQVAKGKFTFNNLQTARPTTLDSFPNITISYNFKPIYEWIQELSGIQNTNTGAELTNGTNPVQRSMLFYIDENDDFHWEYPANVITSQLNGALTDSATTITVDSTSNFESSGTISIGNEQITYTGTTTTTFTGCTRGANRTVATSHSDNTDVYEALAFVEGVSPYIISYKLKYDTSDVINMIIFRGGKDLKGEGVLWYYFDTSSSTTNLRVKIMDWKDIAQEIKRAYYGSYNKLDGSHNSSVGTITVDSTTGFNSAGTAMIQSREGGNEVVTYTGTTATTLTGVTRGTNGTPAMAHDDNDVVIDVTDLYDFTNTQVRTAIKTAGEIRAANILKRLGSARWKGTITTQGIKLTPGGICRVIIPSNGLNGILLRIHDIVHNITRNTWTTEIELEEDEKSVQQQDGT